MTPTRSNKIHDDNEIKDFGVVQDHVFCYLTVHVYLLLNIFRTQSTFPLFNKDDILWLACESFFTGNKY